MPVINELHIGVKTERIPVTVLNRLTANGETYATPMLDTLKALVESNGVGTVDMAFQRVDGYVSEDSDEFVMCSVLSLHVDDFDTAETLIAKLAEGTDLAGALEFFRAGSREQREESTPCRAIEIYYDVEAIPPDYADALDFRNEAMELIEAALTEADAGEWSGAESGMGEVNFGFEVADFDQAEKVVRAAVADTPFSAIREITRFPPDSV